MFEHSLVCTETVRPKQEDTAEVFQMPRTVFSQCGITEMLCWLSRTKECNAFTQWQDILEGTRSNWACNHIFFRSALRLTCFWCLNTAQEPIHLLQDMRRYDFDLIRVHSNSIVLVLQCEHFLRVHYWICWGRMTDNHYTEACHAKMYTDLMGTWFSGLSVYFGWWVKTL